MNTNRHKDQGRAQDRVKSSGQESPARHLAILTEYDGSAFHGWQYQENAGTVQQTIQQAWWQLTGERMTLTGSSRTDAGVHARGHVSDYFTASRIPTDRIALALNSRLPEAVTVLAAQAVPDDFNARFSATGKRYHYQYWLQRSRPALDRRTVCHVPGPLDVAAMQAALPYLAGEHDYTSMMDQGSVVRRTIRTIHQLSLTQQGPLLTLCVEGDGFLYHMVRILAGTLLYIGQGKIRPAELPAILQAKDRRLAGKTMPSAGLCLDHVCYENELFLQV